MLGAVLHLPIPGQMRRDSLMVVMLLKVCLLQPVPVKQKFTLAVPYFGSFGEDCWFRAHDDLMRMYPEL